MLLPRLDSCGRGRAAGTASVSVTAFSSMVCFSLYPETSDRLDKNEAVRRFRSRFTGCVSSFLGVMLVNALREPPKMLLRLSLDMVGVDCRPCLLAGAAPREVSGSIGACGWLWTGWREEAHAQTGVGVIRRCGCEMSNLAANGAQITVAWGCGRRFEQVPRSKSRMSMSIWRYERSPAWSEARDDSAGSLCV